MVEDPAGITRPDLAAPPFYPVEFQSLEVASDDRLVTIHFQGGNATCWSVKKLEVKYEQTRVLVAMIGGYNQLPKDVFCTAEGVNYTLKARLDQAVGSRTLVPVGR